MQVGNIVKSLKGHDTGRVYLVIAAISEDFVLLSDGRYRKLDYPKQKRIKHLEILSQDCNACDQIKDSDIRKVCKLFQEGNYAERG